MFAGERQHTRVIPVRQALLGLLLALVPFAHATAHEIPNAVTARLLARPAADRFQLLVRVPLAVIRDVEFPAQPSGYLDIERLGPQLPDLATLWIARAVELYEDNSRLPPPRVAATQLSVASDRSFASFEQALRHVREPLPANSEHLAWEQVFFDVLLEYPIQSARSRFALRPGLDHLAVKVVTSLEFHSPEGVVRPFQLHGDPGLVPLDPSWAQAAGRFMVLGFRHIPDGSDHLLFLLCLVIPFRRPGALVGIVTAFTLAHSITLIGAVLGVAPKAVWFPAAIETLIAVTILFTAIENIVAQPGERRRAILAGGFGLIHGFGFAFAFQESLQYAGARLFTALFAFNLGVEVGQLVVIAILAILLNGLARLVIDERKVALVLSALIAHSAWHWMIERGTTLMRYDVDGWSLVSWTFAVIVLVVVGWLAQRRRARGRIQKPRSQEPAV